MPKEPLILAVDDSPETLEIISRILSTENISVITAISVESAVEILNNQTPSMVITDMKMPGVSGLEFIRYIKQRYSSIPVIMITGHPTIDSAVQSIKYGADDYLLKPFTAEELVRVVRGSLSLISKQTITQGKQLKYDFIGISKKADYIRHVILKLINSTDTVLITGESGTGKEVIARTIHYNSKRADGPFVTVNCSAIPDTLFESELFGHVKGAFTGANFNKPGFFQTADGGTIFLDEISEITTTMQAKLLRVIQNKEITMVGSGKTQIVDIQIIAASNQNLQELVSKKLFREDLFYRLNVIGIEIPPLRDRKVDISVMTDYFMEKYKREYSKNELKLDSSVYELFNTYNWPGNVRELENLIKRLVILSETTSIKLVDLPDDMKHKLDFKKATLRTLEEVEQEHILTVLYLSEGNKTRAAEILQIDRKTLREKLNKISLKSISLNNDK